MNPLALLFDRYALEPNGKMPLDLPIGRAALAVLFAELGYTRGAEIGVERGHFAAHLCQVNPGLTLYAVDPWTAYPTYREHVSQKQMDGFYAEAVQRLAPHDAHLVRAFSVEAACQFAPGSLDFVYIDGNHEFLHVTQDIALWSARVRSGGIVAGHDFTRRKGRNYTNHVKDVVQAWAYAHGVRPWFVCRGDKAPSWFWVQP